MRRLSARAAACFEGEDPAHRIERVYHRLVAVPTEAADQLERLWKEWDRAGRHELLQALGIALDELAGTDHLAAAARAGALCCLGWIRADRMPVADALQLAKKTLALFLELGSKPGEMDARQQLGDGLLPVA